MTRTLLHEVDDEIDELSLHGTAHSMGASRRERSGWLDRGARWVTARLPEPVGEDPTEMAYAEATARRLAARRTSDALEVFDDSRALRRETVERARRTVAGWEQEAIEELDHLDSASGTERQSLHVRQVRTLAQAASRRELRELVETGLLPEQALTAGTAVGGAGEPDRGPAR